LILKLDSEMRMKFERTILKYWEAPSVKVLLWRFHPGEDTIQMKSGTVYFRAQCTKGQREKLPLLYE
ncbi:MAG TPA: hypothetical protein VNZ45_05400, partial [Bacteroidia bacterium]|nr:hypothetical protein [Bacteroidia bacterium]